MISTKNYYIILSEGHRILHINSYTDEYVKTRRPMITEFQNRIKKFNPRKFTLIESTWNTDAFNAFKTGSEKTIVMYPSFELRVEE